MTGERSTDLEPVWRWRTTQTYTPVTETVLTIFNCRKINGTHYLREVRRAPG